MSEFVGPPKHIWFRHLPCLALVFVVAGCATSIFALPRPRPVKRATTPAPSVVFSTFLGGGIDDGATGMVRDSAGNIYIVGTTNSPDFPTTPGAFQTHLNGVAGNVFISKFSPDGSKLIFSTYLGGTGLDQAVGVAVDPSGSVYVTGTTSSADFPLANAFQAQATTPAVFVSKLAPDGSGLAFSTYFGNRSQAGGIAVDGAGEAIFVGNAGNGGIPIVNALQPTHGADKGGIDAFVAQFNASGSALMFSTYWGGNSGDYATGMTMDASGNIFVTGVSNSTNFPVTSGAF